MVVMEIRQVDGLFKSSVRPAGKMLPQRNKVLKLFILGSVEKLVRGFSDCGFGHWTRLSFVKVIKSSIKVTTVGSKFFVSFLFRCLNY